MACPLKIIFWNAAGILRQRDEFADFLRRKCIDIALISETFLKPADTFKIHDFTIYREDRQIDPHQRSQGGVAVIIRKDIKHHLVPNPVSTLSLELCTIKVQDNNIGSFFCTSLYRNCHVPIDLPALEVLLNLGNTSIIAGDFNAKHQLWNSSKNTYVGIKLEKFLRAKHDVLATASPEPTRFDSCTGLWDTIDLALFKNIKWNFDIHALDVLNSDHVPVLIELQSVNIQRYFNPSYTHNWSLFHDSLLEKNPNFNLDDENAIDAAIEILTEDIISALGQCKMLVDPKKELLPVDRKSVV